ncbi:hypothetical protein [Variovorax sp.]
MHEFHKGVLYALGAAALNATIGVLTKFVVAMGCRPTQSRRSRR